MVIGTRYDPATPYSFTQPYADHYPDASVMTVEGYGHTTLGASTCANAAIADYLTTLEATDGAVCDQDVAPFSTPAGARPFPDVTARPALVPGGRWQHGSMIEVRPATSFADVRTMVGPKRPDANVCWCLSYRLTNAEHRELSGPARGEKVKNLVRQKIPPGVLAYDGDDVVGWAGVHPRADTSFATNRRIPHVDDLDVWSVWCLRVRPGHRGEGISHALLEGAVSFARDHGAPAIEGYPLDNEGAKVDLTMAYVGTRALFERAGFTKASDTTSRLDGFPRVLMRLALT